MTPGSGDIADIDKAAIAEILTDAPVTLGVLYGSHARNEADRASDVDVAVAFETELSSRERTRARLSLIERLSRALGTDTVDVTPLDRAPPALLAAIQTDGIVLHGDESALEEYESDQAGESKRGLADLDEALARLERVV